MQNGTSVAYNGNSFQTANIMAADIDLESPPDLDAKLYDLAHGNAVRAPYAGYPSKTIPISGTITAASIPALDSQLDQIRAWFAVQSGTLDVGYAGSTRRFNVVQAKISIKRPGGLTSAKYTATFTCQPFGQDTGTTTALNANGRTGGSYTDTWNFTGNAPYQQPIITLTYTAVSSGGVNSVSVGNNNNGQAITITRSWSAGDAVVIDCTQKTVTVNGSPFDFSGAFPEFAPGVGYIGYADGFTSRTFNYNVVYYARYM